MKVNVINFHHVLNYGAVIQGYALCKFLNDNGHEAKLIDYRPFYFLSQTYRPSLGVRKSIKKVKMNFNFYDFRKNYFNLTEKVFYNSDALQKYFKGSQDAFVCGSDQVWNAKITNNRIDSAYFLEFVPESARKISYAASIGHTKFSRKDKEHIQSNLLSYHSLSVREDFAKSEVVDITDGKCIPDLVIDPTLILEDYSEILDTSLVPKEDYMVVYSTENHDDFREYVSIVSRKLNIKVLNLGHYPLDIPSTDLTYIHPSKWLGVFSKASYVCTNSFHGTAFSIIFQRNFTVFGRQTMKDLNRRQLTLMKSINLEHRFLHCIGDFNDDHLNEIDYSQVDEGLTKIRKFSRQFLLNSLD